MHLVRAKYVSGRFKSGFRYSNIFVHKNFSWRENPSDKQVNAIEDGAHKVLDIREMVPGSSLADLYDPLTMPPELIKGHQVLDKAIDPYCRPKPFPNDSKRIEYIFELYDKYTMGLFRAEKTPKKQQKAPAAEKPGQDNETNIK